MRPARRDLLRALLAASPLLLWASWGSDDAATVLVSWALVAGAAALTFTSVARAETAWALVLWLYATPVLGFLREAPSLTLGAGLLLSAAGLHAAGHERWGRWAAAGIAALGALLGLVMMLAMAGTAQGGTQPPDLGAALFSSRRGLLFHWPVLWAGLLGLPFAARGAAAGAGGLLVLLLAAACRPEARAAVGLLVLPFLAPGLGAGLSALRRLAASRPLVPLSLAGAGLVVWNLLFMRLYRDELIPRDDTVAFPQVVEGNARLLAQAVGSPVAWPANWLFALRHRLSPDRFDLAAGKELPVLDGRLALDVGRRDLDEALLAEGWSVRHPCGAEVCRAVEGRARALLPLPDREWHALVVTGGGPGRLVAYVNGGPVGRLTLGGPGAVVSLAVPPARWRRGLNEVMLDAPDGAVLVDRLAVWREGASVRGPLPLRGEGWGGGSMTRTRTARP